MTEPSKHAKDWAKFFDAKGIKRNLVQISLYLLSYELLKAAIVDRIRSLLSLDVEHEEDVPSQTYKEQILNKRYKGKQNIFLASLDWLKDNGALTAEELQEISEITKHRNDVAHRIDRIIADSSYYVDEEKQNRIYELLRKIECRHILTFDVATNPDFDGQEITEADVMSGNEILFTYVKNVSDELLQDISKDENKSNPK